MFADKFFVIPLLVFCLFFFTFIIFYSFFFFFSSRRRHTRSLRDWSSDVCSSDLGTAPSLKKKKERHPEEALAAQRIAEDMVARVDVLMDLGVGYLSLERKIGRASCRERV